MSDDGTDYSVTSTATTGTRTHGGEVHEPPADDMRDTKRDCPHCGRGHLWTDEKEIVCDHCFATRQSGDRTVLDNRSTTLDRHRDRYDPDNTFKTERYGATVMGPSPHHTYEHSGLAICYGGYTGPYAENWGDVIEP